MPRNGSGELLRLPVLGQAVVAKPEDAADLGSAGAPLVKAYAPCGFDSRLPHHCEPSFPHIGQHVKQANVNFVVDAKIALNIKLEA